MKNNNKKGYTLIELIVTISFSTILMGSIFSGINSLVAYNNEEKVYKNVNSEITQGFAKAQKIIYENGVGITSSKGTYSSGNLLSFTKEDEYGIEHEYYLIFNTECTLKNGGDGAEILITNGINDNIYLTKCFFYKNQEILFDISFLNEDLKQKILNIKTTITSLENNSISKLKHTFFIQ